jgi:hypothetical protein
MLLLDKLFTWPASGLLWVIEELEQAAREERTAEADAIRGELRELYLELESGAMTEEAFDAREGELLDRLETLEEAMRADAEEDDEDDEEDDEDEEEEEEEEDE